ncbi:MAG: hypothetical protein DRI24_24000, partial [Deltaproteobacteria bacterium]
MAMHISYEIPDDKIERVGEIMLYTENMSTQELLEQSMELLEWAITQVESGKDIVAINGISGTHIPVKLPL